MTRREFFQRRIPRYRKDPLLFFKEVTHFEPDPWQREAAVAVSQHRRVAIRSGAGRGQNGTGSQSYVVVHCLFFLPAHRLHRTHDATAGQRPVGRNGKVAGRKPGASNDVHMDEDPRVHERL